MTIPSLPLPDTRPGFASQVPGAGDSLGAGLQAIVQALLQGQQLNQGQQRIDVQNRQVGALEADSQARQQMEAIKMILAQQAAQQAQADQAQIGQAIRSLSPVDVQVPVGGSLSGPLTPVQTPGASFDQALGSVRPDLAGKFLDQGKTAIAERKARDAERVQQKARAATLASVPDFLRPATQAMFLVLESTGSKEAANNVFDAVSSAVTPEQMASLDKQYPDFVNLPVKDKFAAIRSIEQAAAESRLGLGQEPLRQAQRRLADARRLATDQAREFNKKGPESLRAALALTKLVTDEVSDFNNLIAHPELIKAGRSQRISSLFGPDILRQYNNAIKSLGIPFDEVPDASPDPGNPGSFAPKKTGTDSTAQNINDFLRRFLPQGQ